jgi:hypothetical protein
MENALPFPKAFPKMHYLTFKAQKSHEDLTARVHNLEGQQRSVSSIVSNSSTTDKVEGTFHRVSREFSAVSC